MPLLLTWQQVREYLLSDGLRIAVIVIAALVADWALHRVVPPLIRAGVRKGLADKTPEEVEQRTHTLARLFTGSGRAVLALTALLLVLPLVGINIAPLLAGAGVAGLALGIAAQSLVRDVINGFFILLENQYSKGDVVRIAGVTGLVEDVGLRRTILRDMDGTVHFIPHAEVRVVSNLTKEFSRVNIDVVISYKEDLERVFRIIDRVGQELATDPRFQGMIISPPRALRVEELAPSGVVIKVLGETEPMKQWEVAGELRRRLKEAFHAAGIEVPHL
jgi:small-conductance mechanosensitive channel